MLVLNTHAFLTPFILVFCRNTTEGVNRLLEVVLVLGCHWKIGSRLRCDKRDNASKESSSSPKSHFYGNVVLLLLFHNFNVV